MRSKRKFKYLGIIPHDVKEIRKQVYHFKKEIEKNSTDTQFYFPDISVEHGPIYNVFMSQVMKLKYKLLERIEQGLENWLVMFDNGENKRFTNPNWVCLDNFCMTNTPDHILIKTNVVNAIPIFKHLSGCFHYITIDWNAFFSSDTVPLLMSMLVKNGVFAYPCYQDEANIIFPREYTSGTGYVEKSEFLPLHKIFPKSVTKYPHYELESIISFYKNHPEFITPFINEQLGWYIGLNSKCLFYFMNYQFKYRTIKQLQVFFPNINRTPDMLTEQLMMCDTEEEKQLVLAQNLYCPLEDHIIHFERINWEELNSTYSIHYQFYISNWRKPFYRESDITYEQTRTNISNYGILLRK
jgi:hypothetical protein